MSEKQTYDHKIRAWRSHAGSVLETLGVLFDDAGNKNTNVLERAHLQAGSLGCQHLAAMIRSGKIKEESYEFLTWLPKPPPIEKKVKVPTKKKAREGASEYQREGREYKDNEALDLFNE